MKKPELLLPAGSVEAFYAAIEGGADAVYLGMRHFNARERARNFTIGQFRAVLKEAKLKNVKVYLTLNTIIRNNELPELFDILNTISHTSPAAVIIQDLGAYYLIKKYFPKLTIHASTQMAHHNSLGANFADKLGFERVILARELTGEELSLIKKKSKIELEVFIHGALCYSFSGMCLFSSYLGGMSANRRNCRQPCRRKYQTGKHEDYSFNLKDNQQIEMIKKMMKIGISSLKIEGRMKSAEYVYQVAKAYRMLIDDPRKTKEADALLQYDLGREKTAYFPGNSVKDAISKTPFTGLNIGNVIATKPSLTVELAQDIRKGLRLRIMGNDGLDAKAQKIRKILVNGKETEKAEAGDLIELPEMKGDFHKDEQVFMVGTSSMRFPTQMQNMESNNISTFPQKKKQAAIRELAISKPPAKEEIFVRINSSSWLRKLFLSRIDRLIISLPLEDLNKLDLKSNFWQKNISKVIIQLPRFIPEKNIAAWQKAIMQMIKQSVTSFMMSHLSQKLLFDGSHPLKLYTSENVYVLNDAASKMLKEQKITNWIYPLENDFPNLLAGNDRRGIVPLFYYPELFYSRMPVDIPENELFADNRQNFIKKTNSGMTIVLPQHPVSLLQFHKRLVDKGFRRFLIDLSWTNSSSNTLNRLLKHYDNSQPEQPSTTFNFKTGLK